MTRNDDFSHDAAYKALFGHPETVASLVRDFVHEAFARHFDREGVPGDWKRHLNDLGEVQGMMSERVALWQNEARAAGMAEGRAEGMAQGELKNQRELLGAILRSKFGAPLPDWAAAETDLERLRRLATAAACADSLAAFAAAVERERGNTL